MDNILIRIYYNIQNGEVWRNYYSHSIQEHNTIINQLNQYNNFFSYFDLYKNQDEELEQKLLSIQYKGYIKDNKLIFIDNPALKAAEEFYNKNKGDS